jgi:tetratricopeptide (TPR) repeat protein
LVDADPANSKYQRDLAVIHQRTGNMLAATGQPAQAMTHYQESLAIHETLAAADPSNTEARRDLGAAYSKMGEVHAALGSASDAPPQERIAQWREARGWFQQSRDIFVGIRNSGILRDADASVPDKIAKQIANCDSVLDELELGTRLAAAP